MATTNRGRDSTGEGESTLTLVFSVARNDSLETNPAKGTETGEHGLGIRPVAAPPRGVARTNSLG